MENANTATIRFFNTVLELTNKLEYVGLYPMDTHNLDNFAMYTDGKVVVALSCIIDSASDDYGETTVTMQDATLYRPSKVVKTVNNQTFGDCGRMDSMIVCCVLSELVNWYKEQEF